jgi:hypothetical protein
MRIAVALGAMLAAAPCACAAAAEAPAVEIKDAVAQVTVIPEARADVRVEILRANPRLPLKVRQGRRTVIDGGLKPRRIKGCSGSGAGAVAHVAQLGEVPLSQMPHIIVHAPRDVVVSAGGAVYGSVGRATNVTLGNAGCGDWTVANVDQELKVALAGSGGVRAGASAFAKLRTAGSGDISVGEVRGEADVNVAGSGDVRVRSVAGDLAVHVAGSGDVVVQGGRAHAMSASIAGSGSVVFDGVADSLQARIAGSGDVRVRRVRGAVKKTVVGSGVVKVG